MYLRLLKSLLAATVLLLAAAPASALQVGDRARDFSLPSTTTTGNIRLSDFAGRKSLVVFFYNGAFQRL